MARTPRPMSSKIGRRTGGTKRKVGPRQVAIKITSPRSKPA